MITFVDFNDNESRDETKNAQKIKEGMDVSAQNFLWLGTGWLQNQNGLNLNQNRSNVQELPEYQYSKKVKRKPAASGQQSYRMW